MNSKECKEMNLQLIYNQEQKWMKKEKCKYYLI